MCGVVRLYKGNMSVREGCEDAAEYTSQLWKQQADFLWSHKARRPLALCFECKWGIAALAHPAPVLWMRPMVVLNIPKGILHRRVFWSLAPRPQGEFTAAQWTPNRPVSCLLMFNIMTCVRAERTMGRKKSLGWFTVQQWDVLWNLPPKWHYRNRSVSSKSEGKISTTQKVFAD